MGKKKKERKRLEKMAKREDFNLDVLDAINDLVTGKDTEAFYEIIETGKPREIELPAFRDFLPSNIRKTLNEDNTLDSVDDDDTESYEEAIANHKREEMLDYNIDEEEEDDYDDFKSNMMILNSNLLILNPNNNIISIDKDKLSEDDLEGNDDYTLSLSEMTDYVIVKLFDSLSHLEPLFTFTRDEFNEKYSHIKFSEESIYKFVEFDGYDDKVFLYYIDEESCYDIHKFIRELYIDKTVFNFVNTLNNIITLMGISFTYNIKDINNEMIFDEFDDSLNHVVFKHKPELFYPQVLSTITDEIIATSEEVELVVNDEVIINNNELNSESNEEEDDEILDLRDDDSEEEIDNEIKVIDNNSKSDFVIERK